MTPRYVDATAILAYGAAIVAAILWHEHERWREYALEWPSRRSMRHLMRYLAPRAIPLVVVVVWGFTEAWTGLLAWLAVPAWGWMFWRVLRP
jgi:hypothetical protein